MNLVVEHIVTTPTGSATKFAVSILPTERQVLKLILLAFFGSCAHIIVKSGREEVAPDILLTAIVKTFRVSFGEFRPRK